VRVKMFDPGNFTPHYVKNLSEALAAHGVEVDLITSQPLFEEIVYDDSVHLEYLFFRTTAGTRRAFFLRHAKLRQTVKLLSYPVGLWRTWRALSDQPPGILHMQWSLIPLFDMLLMRKLRSKGWIVIYTAHELVAELEQRFKRWSFGPVYRQSDAVIVHTAALGDKLLEGRGADLKEVCEIPSGVSTFPLLADLHPRRAREFLGLDSTAPVLLFFGLIKRYKGLEYLLRAWRLVLDEFPAARLVIAGEAMLPMSPFRQIIRNLGLGHSIVERLGYVPETEVQYLFCAADAVALPYISITTSAIVPLAYRFARPVIATTTGGLPELVRDGQTGFLVPPCSEAPLAEAICRGFRDRAALASMGARGRQWYERERTWDEIARRTITLYEALSAGRAVAERESVLR
jgi:D-inositol-3-phosphate glycosyltransferase